MPGRLLNGYVRKIKIDKPSLSNNISDSLRLKKALKNELDTDNIRLGLPVLKVLPSCLRSWGYKLKIILFKDLYSWVLAGIVHPDSKQKILGVAMDIGTTRIVLRLVDLETGENLIEKDFPNPQIEKGPDVLARIHYANSQNGLEVLNSLIINEVNSHIEKMCNKFSSTTDEIYLFSGAGNTAMTHLFLGIDPYEIIKEPYIPCVNIPETYEVAKLGLNINENGFAYLFPNIGSYFGGDLLAGILFSKLYKKEKPSLLVDVGTNAEIVVGNKDWLIACAGAAGPALEGGVSKMGMTAKPGVIDKVVIDPQTCKIDIHTLGDQPPVGICGSGMIDFAAGLFLSGMIDIRGKFSKSICGDRLFTKDDIDYFMLVEKKNSATGEDILFSQIDLNSLTSSKAAMYTILEVIVMKTAGLDFHDLDKFYVAGTFGSYINPISAISIGMLPDIDIEKFEVLGNSSLGGATILLKDSQAYDEILKIRESITYIELNVNQEFMNMFSGAKFYPHTDRSRFPSLENIN